MNMGGLKFILDIVCGFFNVRGRALSVESARISLGWGSTSKYSIGLAS